MLVLCCQCFFQQRVNGSNPVNKWLALHLRFVGFEIISQCSLRLYEIDGGQEAARRENVSHVGAHLFREVGQNADDFPALVGLQFANAVVGLHHLGWLDKDCLSRCALVVDDAADSALQGWCHRDDQPAVAYGRRHILINQSFALGSMQDAVQRSRDASLGMGQFAADVAKLG